MAMESNKKLQLYMNICKSLPDSESIIDWDVESESDAVRFTWRDKRFRVTTNCLIETVEPGILVSSNEAMILGELLKNIGAKQLKTKNLKNEKLVEIIVKKLPYPQLIENWIFSWPTQVLFTWGGNRIKVHHDLSVEICDGEDGETLAILLEALFKAKR